MTLPQREITACPFHSERKQKSEENGPLLGRWGARAYLAGLLGHGRMEHLRHPVGETRALAGRDSPAQAEAGLPSKGFVLFKALLQANVVSCYSVNRYKKISAGTPGTRDKGSDWKGGWVQEPSGNRRVWPGPPVFPRPPSGPCSPEEPAGNTRKEKSQAFRPDWKYVGSSSPGGSGMSPSGGQGTWAWEKALALKEQGRWVEFPTVALQPLLLSGVRACLQLHPSVLLPKHGLPRRQEMPRLCHPLG